MTVSPNTFTRAAGICAVAAGALFIGVQIGRVELATMPTRSIRRHEAMLSAKQLAVARAVRGPRRKGG
ncbi:MAG: hypothetical protein JWQ93_786 [Marmoricola sp.]|nr:hypothetical protein [Marmoricola sp.]